MTLTTADSSGRTVKLLKRFRDVISGTSQIRTSRDAQIFLESVVDQQPPVVCVEKLLGSSHGLEAIRASVRADLSLPFIQSHTLGLFTFLSDPSIKALAEGQFLWRLLEAIANPPMVWKAIVEAFLNNQLTQPSLQPFAWLALELISSPYTTDYDFSPDVEAIMANGALLQATAHETRSLAAKIQHALSHGQLDGAGGRHDNDFADIREIAIYPTRDEILSTERPFYRQADEVFEVDKSSRTHTHLDNQFRLLREDMLAELRNDLQIAVGRRSGRRSAHTLHKLVPTGIEFGEPPRGKKCSVTLKCHAGLHELQKIKEEEGRKRFLRERTNYLGHRAFGALFKGEAICGFAFIDRDVNLLAQNPPVVCLQFTDTHGLQKSLSALKQPAGVYFTLLDTPVFAYEPVLKVLQSMNDLPLDHILMDPDSEEASQDFKPGPQISKLIASLSVETDAKGEIRLDETTRIDASQRDALVSALSQEVSVIQGPPGTGKSFVGSRAVEALYSSSELRILVISYTNHALDQSLEHFLDLGIPQSQMVRLGSKSTDRTSDLLLFNQTNRPKNSAAFWSTVDDLKKERSALGVKLKDAFNDYIAKSPSFVEVLEYLEFAEDKSAFFDALTVPSHPSAEAGWHIAWGSNRAVGPDYLFNRWKYGQNPGVFADQVPTGCGSVWSMSSADRWEELGKWHAAITSEGLESIKKLVSRMDDIQVRVDDLHNEGKVETLRSKRIIGCTTTAAASHMKLLRAAEPHVVLVEEAGEILESHVLTALAPTGKQLILIGDHKQLRPKVKNYALTVEKGDGFDLNRSLFERLVLGGFKFTTLTKQHRMHPDISCFPRALTYPGLLDGPKTASRPEVDGLRDRVIFVNHEHPESSDSSIGDRQDGGAKGSKMNEFEAVMVLRYVRYLAQQGYGTEKMVVLTPYLGQLRMLKDLLGKDMDPVLNDLDSSELLRAGLMTHAASKVAKRPLRLSTIDNYQGEENDIVIVSLTRSNKQGDIGFMIAPERLNVLITRARCCLVMIGNMDTFMSSKKGKSTWTPYFELLKERGHLYDGLPVICVRHPHKMADIKSPEEFEALCRDGGCDEPCDAPLPCGVHKCERRCHRVSDHSQVECTIKIERTCPRQHTLRVNCGDKSGICAECAREDEEEARKIQHDLEMEQSRLERQDKYRLNLQKVADEQDRERRRIKDMDDEEEEKKNLEREQQNLRQLQEARARKMLMREAQQAAGQLPDPSNSGPIPDSTANSEWQELKRLEGAENGYMDELMGMIGLEEVKETFLAIKTTIDTKLRQNVELEKQRYGAILLGNPGTGKTTVARLYAKFLFSLCAISGSHFEETTGSKLAGDGVKGCKTLVETTLKNDGGVIFIDEAYQLTSGDNQGGKAVLDYLLAEIENLTGKIVFIVAGYNKQMETFFQHNPGIRSRFPYEMKFADYSDEELRQILAVKIYRMYGGRMKCEDGDDGLYCRIIARRIGRGRDQEGFGNARTVETTLDRIAARQATRLSRERRKRKGLKPDDFLFTKEDIIGPPPADALQKSKGWWDLGKLHGLDSVKESVKALVSTAQQNYQRELDEQPPIEYSLNKVFLGNPGTGKTTVAKHYGQILVDLGMLSKGELVVKNPSDFVDSVVGGSEKKTRGILASTVGKVLVIDEAYGLGGTGSDSRYYTDPFRIAVIDTIVAEVQSVPGDDRCVILIGYKDQLETMYQTVNPGLSRRFPLSEAFTFEDFTPEELRKILDLKLKQQGFSATPAAKRVAMEMLARARNRANFGNAGEIDIILNATKARHQTRLDRGEAKDAIVLEPLDFDENFDRADRNETNVKMLFQGTLGTEDIVAKLEDYQATVRSLKKLDLDPKPEIPFNFLFRGPPGTGKTTTAKKMGKVFYDMGFLATAEVMECSATDLVGEYIGSTGPKVLKLLDKALGKVLFIDEAYRLGDGHFGKEAMDELVDSATKPRYFKKMIIILAGYEREMNQLMDANSGLTSRFPEVIDFRPLDPDECFKLLVQLLSSKGAKIPIKKSAPMDISALTSPTADFLGLVGSLFADLAAQPNWANARDVDTAAKNIFGRAIKMPNKQIVVDEALVFSELQALIKERESRAKAGWAGKGPMSRQLPIRTAPTQPPPPPPPMSTDTATTQASSLNTTPTGTAANTPPESRASNTPTGTAANTPPESRASNTPTGTAANTPPESRASSPAPSRSWESPPQTRTAKTNTDDRDPGGSGPSSLSTPQRDAGVSDAVWEQLQRDRQAEQEREDEYQRLKKAEREARDADRDKLVRRLVEEDKRRKQEEAMKAKLEKMGKCPVGYSWIKQAQGYRCAGGSHYMSDEELQGA